MSPFYLFITFKGYLEGGGKGCEGILGLIFTVGHFHSVYQKCKHTECSRGCQHKVFFCQLEDFEFNGRVVFI